MNDDDFFSINGGHCYIVNGKLHLEISTFAFENIYKINFFISLFIFLAAMYSFFTGWIYYGKIKPVPWYILLLFGFLLNYAVIIRVYQVLTGFTFDKEIPLDSIRSIGVVHNESKVFRVRSEILIKYNKKGEEKKRRIYLYEKESFGSKDDVYKAMNFLDRHGLKYDYKKKSKEPGF